MNDKLAIIGGGISGITSALTLQLLGYQTVVYAEHLVDDKAPEDPRFASLYPAASVIPHSVETDQLDTLFPPSQEIFQLLLDNNFPGMRLHRHFELYEFPKEDPSYAPFMKSFQRIDSCTDQHIPKRPDAGALHGWIFDCFVAEWPVYIQQLYTWYRKSKGEILQKRVTRSELKKFPTDIMVNCAGIWSTELFADEEPERIVRGQLLHVKDAPMLRENDLVPSYNYTPQTEVYSDPEGKPSDVYFYPRVDGWILGGSRQKGTLHKNGSFKGPQMNTSKETGGVAMPPQILELNREIVRHTYGLELGDFGQIKSKEGFRYVRKYGGDGLRLEVSREYGKTIIHNYGHGGAGVTLSWGCALEVVRMVGERVSQPVNLKKSSLISLLKNKLGMLSS